MLKEAQRHNKSLEKPSTKKAERPDISAKGLKKQRDYIVDKVDEAIANPPDTHEIHIDVPGDGEFKIHNEKRALTTFKENVMKHWPTSQLRTPYPSHKKR